MPSPLRESTQKKVFYSGRTTNRGEGEPPEPLSKKQWKKRTQKYEPLKPREGVYPHLSGSTAKKKEKMYVFPKNDPRSTKFQDKGL